MALLLPAVQQAREAARRDCLQCELGSTSLALQHFESSFRSFPAGAEASTLHSWSTRILPFLEQDGLYQRIDFNAAWDAPKNAPWSRQNLAVFTCPSSRKNYGGRTDYSGISAHPTRRLMMRSQRHFVSARPRGTTGEHQLDSRRNEPHDLPSLSAWRGR